MAESPYSLAASEDEQYARSKLLPVATSLLVLSVLTAYLLIGGIAVFAMRMVEAMQASTSIYNPTSFVVWMTVGLLNCLIISAGGLSMLGRRSYTFARITCLLAIVPLLGCLGFGLGIPIGIWGFRVLGDPIVRATFDTGPGPSEPTEA